MAALWRKATRLWQFVALGPLERDYVRFLKATNAVDRSHYRTIHHRINPLFRIWPERHYVAYGESQGLSPTPTFVPYAYLRRNPSLTDIPHPFRHYLTEGQQRGLACADDVHPGTFASVQSAPLQASTAVVLHLYFLDLWPDFHAWLAATDIDFDLFVTLTEQPDLAHKVRADIQREYPASRVEIMPNHGRDIYPFVRLLNSGQLDSYTFVCKLHGKRSVHRDNGDIWRERLVSSLLPADRVGEMLQAFESSDASVLAADQGLRSDARAWGDNKARVASLLKANPGPRPAPFPAGSMFWAKQPALSWLQSLDLTSQDFEPELGQLDGTTAHAIERLIGYAAQQDNSEATTVDRL